MTSRLTENNLYKSDASCDVAVTTTDDDATQYLEDPELIVDILPQPFRRINRILNSIINNALEIAKDHEAKLIHDARRRQAPKYDSANILQVLLNLCFMLIFCKFLT